MATKGTGQQSVGALPKPSKSEIGKEMGVTLNLPFASAYTSPGVPAGQTEIQSSYSEEDGPSISQLVAMRRTDGQARALYRLITLPIRSALKSVKIVPTEDGTAEAEFIDRMFNLPYSSGGMEISFSQVISQMLMSVFDGFAAFEEVYHVPNAGPLKGKVCLRKAAYRPSETVSFLVDDNGNFTGFRQRVMFKGELKDVNIPGSRAFWITANDEERPFYGVSYFQSAFYHYDKKVKLYYLAHLAAQHRAVGSRIGDIPSGASASDTAKFKAALRDFGFAQSLMLPPGFKVRNEYPGSSFDFLSMINHHNSQMSKSVLAAFFDQQEGGDKAIVDFGQQSDAMFIMMLQSIMGEVADVINQRLIPKFIDWNFGTGKYPTFSWGTFTDEQRRSISLLFDRLATAGAGANVTPEFMAELEKRMSQELGLDIDYAVIDERARAKAASEGVNDQAFQDFLNNAGLDSSAVPPQDSSSGNVPPQDPAAALSAMETLADPDSLEL